MNPGDVVYLKSDGPALTVICPELVQLTPDGPQVEYAIVTWFSGKEDRTRSFPVTSLTKTEPTV